MEDAAQTPLTDQPPNNGQPPSGQERRQAGRDRRGSGIDRRSGLDRRRGPGRRRTDHRREAEEGHMNEEQLDFILAMEEFKHANGCPFPTWTDVLDVALYLGYRKVAPRGEHRITTVRDAGGEDAAAAQ